MATFTPAQAAFSRVFIIDGQAHPENEPDYHSCLRAGSFDWSLGDVEPIQCPDPNNWGQFIEVGEMQGAVERASSSLIGRYAADLASTLLEIARRRCAVDVQLNLGRCTDPRVFNVFTKKFIWEDVRLTNFATEDLGALSSDENAPVNESSDLSIQDPYEVLQLTFQLRGGDLVDNAVVDVIICSIISCGECEDPDSGCDRIYALQGGILGSPGTPPDIIYSLDKGATWALNEVNSLGVNEAADALACLMDYIVVVSNDSNSQHYKLQSSVNAGTLGGWTEVGTGYVNNAEPNDIWSVGTAAFVVGDNGYVYLTTDPTTGVSVLDAGVATTADLMAVHAIDEDHAVAVGEGDDIIYTVNQANWVLASATGSGQDLLAVWMRRENEWWVGGDDGELWYTNDGGVNWTQKLLPDQSNISEIDDIQFPKPSVGYVAGTIGTGASAVGALWRTYNGGYTWVRLPEGAGNLPDSDSLDAVATCGHDPNFVVAVGEVGADDGVIMIGED